MKDDDEYAFVIYNGTHFKSAYKWIMDSGTTKHMTSHRAIFDMYEVIDTHNIHLDNNSVVEVIKMRYIIMKVIMRSKINRICIKYALHVLKLQTNLFLVNKPVSNSLKVQFNLNEYFVRVWDDKIIIICATQRQLVQNEFCKDARRGCGQRDAIFNVR